MIINLQFIIFDLLIKILFLFCYYYFTRISLLLHILNQIIVFLL